MAKIKNAPTILVKKHKGKGKLGRPSNRFEDNIKMDLKIIGFTLCTGFV
jgi:hypothetical protein